MRVFFSADANFLVNIKMLHSENEELYIKCFDWSNAQLAIHGRYHNSGLQINQ